jgi:hypothetical protein
VAKRSAPSSPSAGAAAPIARAEARLPLLGASIAKLVRSYAADFESRFLTEDNIERWIEEFISIGQTRAGLSGNHLSKLRRTLPIRKVKRYLQLENKILAIATYDLAAQVPLAP